MVILPWLIGGAVVAGAKKLKDLWDEVTEEEEARERAARRVQSEAEEARRMALLEKSKIEQKRILDSEKKKEKAWEDYVSVVQKTNCDLQEKVEREKLGKICGSGTKTRRILWDSFGCVYGWETSGFLGGVAGLRSSSGASFTYRKSKLDGDDALKAQVCRQKIETIDFLLLDEVGAVLWTPTSLLRKGLTSEMRSSLFELCAESDVKELERFLEEAGEMKPRLVAAGLLKAGKSTMMNCLVGDFENKRFKTGVVRETTQEKVYEKDGYRFVDTPGIDANDEDTKVAEGALRVADVILFAHNLRSGALDEPERQFLKTIQENWDNPSSFVKKTLFVLTHLDGVEGQKDKVQLVENTLRKQIEDIFGVAPSVISVSSSKYQKGCLENKALLEKNSNYSTLRKELAEKIEHSTRTKKEKDRLRIKTQAEGLKKTLSGVREGFVSEIMEIEAQHKEQCEEFRADVKAASEKVERAYSIYVDKVERA